MIDWPVLFSGDVLPAGPAVFAGGVDRQPAVQRSEVAQNGSRRPRFISISRLAIALASSSQLNVCR